MKTADNFHSEWKLVEWNGTEVGRMEVGRNGSCGNSMVEAGTVTSGYHLCKYIPESQSFGKHNL